MIRPSAEILLISAIINSGDATAAESFGVTPEMFVGYQAEYRWVFSYPGVYAGQHPSRDALLTKFPDFRITDNKDVAFPADEVIYNHTKREFTKAVREAASSLSDGDLESAVMAVAGFALPSKAKPLVNALSDMSFLDDYNLPHDRLEIGWPTLRATTEGIRPGDLWYVAARLGQGKSWYLGCLTRDALMQGKRVIFYSLEMSEKQVRTRMHTLLGRELGIDVRHSELHGRSYDLLAYKRLAQTINNQVPGTLLTVDSSYGKISPATIASHADKGDLFIVDYAGLLASPAGNRAVDDWRTMASISNQLKELAVSKNIPIISAAQINREGDVNGWRPPKVRNLAQSDALGQDADVVITHKRYSQTAMAASIEKNRHGSSGVLFFTEFDPERGRFNEISREEADQKRDDEDVE
jgi:hypothetical protein